MPIQTLETYYVQIKPNIPKWLDWLTRHSDWYHDNVATRQHIWNVYDTQECRTVYRNQTHLAAHKLCLHAENLRKTLVLEQRKINELKGVKEDFETAVEEYKRITAFCKRCHKEKESVQMLHCNECQEILQHTTFGNA